MADMEERPPMETREDEIDLGVWFAIFRRQWWKICGISLAVGLATLLYMFTKPNLYKSTAVIMPAVEEGKPNPALGALVSMGISVGGPSKIEDLEVLFKSNDLTARVFSRHNHWSVLLGKKYDSATGMLRPSLFPLDGFNDKVPKPPGDWDALRAASKAFVVTTNRKSGSLTLSFESTSAQESAAILKDYLDEAKNRMQEEALGRATENKKFILEQIGKTVDALNRDRLYSLLGQEVEREMMARNREQFGFRVIDSPRAPDRKSGPHRLLISFLVFVLFFVLSSIVLTVWSRNSTTASTGP
jgi:uncharacterized protein involved in exopolysaccharide biosynthesis